VNNISLDACDRMAIAAPYFRSEDKWPAARCSPP